MKLDGRLALAVRREILRCLQEEQQINGAARLLGIGRETVRRHIESFKIAPSDWQRLDPSAPPRAPSHSLSDLLGELTDLLTRYGASPSEPLRSSSSPLNAECLPLKKISRSAPLNCSSRRLPSRSRTKAGKEVQISNQKPKIRNRKSEQSLLTSAATRSRNDPVHTVVSTPITGKEPTIDLFLRLGIDLRQPRQPSNHNGFWLRFESELDYLLADARAAFLSQIKLAHPDRGGPSEEATNLTLAWTVIRRRFARRGIRL